jgi:hypothetical protein
MYLERPILNDVLGALQPLTGGRPRPWRAAALTSVRNVAAVPGQSLHARCVDRSVLM